MGVNCNFVQLVGQGIQPLGIFLFLVCSSGISKYAMLSVWPFPNPLSGSQAELRALEDGDASAGGSSPCSETSQEAAGSRGMLLKKKRWKTAFPSAPSPDSNSIGSDLQDGTDTSESK